MTGSAAPAGVAAVTRAGGRLELFWVGAEQGLFHASFSDGAWSAPEALGGRVASVPAATAWGDEPMEVFAIFDDGALWDRYWDGATWHAWESLGGELEPGSTPAATSSGAERLDVLALGHDGRTWHRWWNGSEWVPWQPAAGR